MIKKTHLRGWQRSG